jgi:hypothetical protein
VLRVVEGEVVGSTHKKEAEKGNKAWGEGGRGGRKRRSQNVKTPEAEEQQHKTRFTAPHTAVVASSNI